MRGKIERCLQVSDGEAAAASASAPSTRSASPRLSHGLDLVVTATVPFVAPPADIDELELRGAATALTYPFSSLGWPALALPWGRAEEGLPASVQLAAPSGGDALILAAGRLLEPLGPGLDRTRLSL